MFGAAVRGKCQQWPLEAQRGAVWAQSHCCPCCAHVQAFPWPSNLLSAFLRSLSLLSGSSPRTVPLASLGAPHPDLEDLVPTREKLLPRLLPLSLDQPVGCTPTPQVLPSKGRPRPRGGLLRKAEAGPLQPS